MTVLMEDLILSVDSWGRSVRCGQERDFVELGGILGSEGDLGWQEGMCRGGVGH